MCERAGAVDVEAFRDVYLRVYAEPPYHEDEAAADRFAGQLREHAALPGFSATTVTDDDGVLGGFAYGVAYDDGWWHPRWMHSPAGACVPTLTTQRPLD